MAWRMATQRLTPTPDATRERLLGAAERILVEHGVHALTVRRIGQVSGLNGTLVTYHFGTMAALATELAQRNLDPIRAEWEAIATTRDDIGALLSAWLAPLLRPAAFNPAGRALLVLDELASHGHPELRDEVMAAMVAVAALVRQRLAPLLPGLTDKVLTTRLRFIAGATLGPPPRAHGGTKTGLADLIAFARSALAC